MSRKSITIEEIKQIKISTVPKYYKVRLMFVLHQNQQQQQQQQKKTEQFEN